MGKARNRSANLGNRFHVKLRILSPRLNFYLNKVLQHLANISLQRFGVFTKALQINDEMVPYLARNSAKVLIRAKSTRFGHKKTVNASIFRLITYVVDVTK